MVEIACEEDFHRYFEALSAALIIPQADWAAMGRLIRNFEVKRKIRLGRTTFDVEVFGSYTRRTLLPASVDIFSDIDILVCVEEERAELRAPITYRNHLQQLAAECFPTGTIRKSSPSVVVELERTLIDLVPCRIDRNGRYAIPADDREWMHTDPHSVYEAMVRSRLDYGRKVQDVARIMKLWNKSHGAPFQSHDLEERVFTYDYCFDTIGEMVIEVALSLSCHDLSARAQSQIESMQRRLQAVSDCFESNTQWRRVEKHLGALFPCSGAMVSLPKQ